MNVSAFGEALLAAKGVSFGDDGGNGKGKGGRRLSYLAKVPYRCAEAFGYNGNLLVGKAYTAILDRKPGDECEIKLGCKQICMSRMGLRTRRRGRSLHRIYAVDSASVWFRDGWPSRSP